MRVVRLAGRAKVAMVFGAALFGGAGATGCGSAAPAPSPVQTVELAPPAPGPELTPTATDDRKPEPFAQFVEQHLADFERGDPAWFGQAVEPSLGVLLLTNPGAYIVATHHATLDDMIENGQIVALDERLSLGCGTEMERFSRLDGAIPKFSCETETWDQKAACLYGEIQSSDLLRFAQLMGEYELVSPSEGAAIVKHVNAVEPKVSHYVFGTRDARGYFFGVVRGKWRLLYVRAIEPCSA